MSTNDQKKYITYAYHGTKRNCNIGANGGETNPCNNVCSVCGILKGVFRVPTPVPGRSGGNFGWGIYSSTESSKANDYSQNINRSDPIKAMFLCTVITGRKNVLTKTNGNLTSPGRNYDSTLAQVVSTATGANETLVYNHRQIKPHAVIMYSLSQTNTGPRPSPVRIYPAMSSRRTVLIRPSGSQTSRRVHHCEQPVRQGA
ncbi:ADP-ribosylation [Exidia glandulosa HHB12029]|uniref:Poly [ADP-ribose] polymerase n=1 Tax=Exidia glandulosa HHB12029 TaxID=1314781 RepID=A0A165BAK0_EXIGL|nr:ADP-ribosylation [Exidia glandulosa HHB12029]